MESSSRGRVASSRTETWMDHAMRIQIPCKDSHSQSQGCGYASRSSSSTGVPIYCSFLRTCTTSRHFPSPPSSHVSLDSGQCKTKPSLDTQISMTTPYVSREGQTKTKQKKQDQKKKPRKKPKGKLFTARPHVTIMRCDKLNSSIDSRIPTAY